MWGILCPFKVLVSGCYLLFWNLNASGSWMNHTQAFHIRLRLSLSLCLMPQSSNSSGFQIFNPLPFTLLIVTDGLFEIHSTAQKLYWLQIQGQTSLHGALDRCVLTSSVLSIHGVVNLIHFSDIPGHWFLAADYKPCEMGSRTTVY